jgi:hypothetical protein
VFKEKVHRHRISSILVADQIYTASLDYTVRKVHERDGAYGSEPVQICRGGVEHIGVIGSNIFSCGRDHYLRSLTSDYFYRCESVPLSFCEADRPNQINLTLANNQLKLFDLEKRQVVSVLQMESKFTAMVKLDKGLLLGTSGSLFGVDWRKEHYL